LFSEQGFKSVRGDLTEGRYLVLEMAGYALTNSGTGNLSATSATAKHEGKAQRWVAHQLAAGGEQFTFSSAVDGSYIGGGGALVGNTTQAVVMSVEDLGNGAGYSLSGTSGYLQISSAGQVGMASKVAGFSVFSVTYNS
jgi:phospholipase C